MRFRKAKIAKIGKLMNLEHLGLLKVIKLKRKSKKVCCITPRIPSQVSLKIHRRNFSTSIVAHLLARQMHIYLKLTINKAIKI